MYLRTTQRRRKDGSTTRYVQLAHNRRVNGVTRAEVLVKLGREEELDLDGLRRLAASIARSPASSGRGASARMSSGCCSHWSPTGRLRLLEARCR